MNRKRTNTINLICLLFLSLICPEVLGQTHKTVFITELSRHGARTPLSNLTQMIQQKWLKESIPGQLTRVGMRQQYYLGKNLFFRYKNFFAELNNTEYRLRSTDFNRTLTSAFSQFFGLRNGEGQFTNKPLLFENNDDKLKPPQSLLFDPSKIGFKTPLKKGTIPFPIYTDPQQVDLTLLSDVQACPLNQQLGNLTWDEANELLKNNENVVEIVKEALKRYSLEEKTKKWAKDFHLCYFIGDFAIQDAKNSMNPIIKPEEDLYRKLKDCYHFGIISYFKKDISAKIARSALLRQIFKEYKEKIEAFNPETGNFPSKILKYKLNSAHDDTLTPHLIQMKQVDYDCLFNQVKTGKGFDCTPTPPLASSIVWELFLFSEQNDKPKFGVKVFYNGEIINYCNGESQEYCTFQEFENVVDLNAYCFEQEDTSFNIGLSYIISALLVLNFGLVLFVMKAEKSNLKNSKRSQTGKEKRGGPAFDTGEELPLSDEYRSLDH